MSDEPKKTRSMFTSGFGIMSVGVCMLTITGLALMLTPFFPLVVATPMVIGIAIVASIGLGIFAVGIVTFLFQMSKKNRDEPSVIQPSETTALLKDTEIEIEIEIQEETINKKERKNSLSFFEEQKSTEVDTKEKRLSPFPLSKK